MRQRERTRIGRCRLGRARIDQRDGQARRRAAPHQPAGKREPDRAPRRRSRYRSRNRWLRVGEKYPRSSFTCIGRSRIAHQSLDFIRIDGHAARDQFAAGGRDDRVVLDADADVPEAFGHVVGGAHVEARLDRQRHACLQRAPWARALIVERAVVVAVVARVVHVHADPVPRAMHVEARVGALGDHVVDAGELVSVDDARIQQALRQHAQRGLMRCVEAHARTRRVDGGRLRGEHDVVKLALRRREAAGRRKRAGDVGGVAVELARGVDQDQVAFAHDCVARRVVQRAGIRAGRDDRPVSRRLRAASAERVEQLGFEFVLAHAWPAGMHRAPVRLGGNRRRAPHDRDFVRALDEAHFVEKRQQVLRFRWRQHAAAALRAHRCEPAAHLFIERGRCAERIVQRGRIGEHARHVFVERVDGERGVEAECEACAFRAEAEAFPRLALGVLLAAEKYRRRLAVFRVGVEDERRFGLGEARQVIEVAVVAERVVGVAVAHDFRRGRHDRHAAARLPERGENAGAAGAVDVDGGFGL